MKSYKTPQLNNLSNSSSQMSQPPEFLHRFFWEYDPAEIDIEKHADIIQKRIMERGTLRAMVWLREIFSKEERASFLARSGCRVLPPRELNYWAMISNVDEKIRKKWVQEARNKKDIWNQRRAY